MTQIDAPGRSTTVPASTDPAPTGAVRVLGAVLSVSAAAWAVSMFVMPEGGAMTVAGTVAAVAFQGSLLGLLALMWRTRATGTGRAGRVLLGIQMGVLAVATVQSVSEVVPGAEVVALVLDPFWPLSMLGMLVVGVTVACVGRWRGAVRGWTPVATSWIALLPTMFVLPEAAIGYVIVGHVLVGYVVLGVILAVRPDLTAPESRR